MQSNRTNFLRSLLQSEPGKPAIANGLRAVLAWGVPMLIGQFTDQRESGLYIATMAYFVNLANVGGPYRIKATAMAAATLGIAFSVLVGTLVAGVPKLVVLLTVLWGVGAGLASLYGQAGTTVGLVVGLSFISAIANKFALDTVALLTVFCGVSLLKVNYGYAVVFISIFILLASNIAHPIGWQFAGIRMLNTLIGAGLAFGGHYLMWPIWERQRFPKQLATALRECRNYFQEVMAVYQGEPEKKGSIISQRRRTGLAISNAQTSFQGLLGEPRTPIGVVEPVMALLVYMKRFTNAVTVLALHLDHFQGTQPLPEVTLSRQAKRCDVSF